jgi:hypothetical protein
MLDVRRLASDRVIELMAGTSTTKAEPEQEPELADKA